MRMHPARTMVTSALLLLPLSAGAAEEASEEKPAPAIELGAPFADHAILQRQMPVPVWGWSAPGTKVTVEFAGQAKTATAGRDGKWMLRLDPLEANTAPAGMTIRDDKGNTVALKDLLVGEVWMASGQSNMQWTTGKSSVGRALMKQIAERVEAGKEKPPVIREAKVTNRCSALHPIEHAEGVWSTEGEGFSAIAYAFAYDLHRELRVPIGILNCAFSTTTIQAWVPREGFAEGGDAYTRAIHQQIQESDPGTPEHAAAWNAYYEELEKTLRENGERVKQGREPEAVSTKTPGNLGGNRDASWMYNARIHPMVPYALRGCIWNQGYASSGEGYVYYHNLHALIRGWRKAWNRPDLPVYFNQFYTPGNGDDGLSLNATAEMRLGTWMAARDIPNAGMASQIDIGGAVHYFNKTIPGQRLARHALKNPYGKDLVADGPMFKSYTVEGDRLVVSFDHAEGGLVVGETGTRAKAGIAVPTVIENGDDKVTLFYLADGNRVWHRATMRIDGETVVLTAPGVSEPRGVAYGCNGIGWLPNLYNRALLPTTPFIAYDRKPVLSTDWPDQPLKVRGVEPDPASAGLLYEYRRMPILSTQFRDNAVLQTGVPVTFWGSAVHDWGYEAKGEAAIHVSFAGIEKTLPVTPGMKTWHLTVPAMEAGAEPKTLKVVLTIDGETAHVRECTNLVVGDVWFVAAPPLPSGIAPGEKSEGIVRMMTRKAKRFTFRRPSRFSVCVSTTPDNRFASLWADAAGLPAALGHRIGRRTGKPVGIVFMQSGTTGKPPVNEITLKSWIRQEDLQRAPSLMEDYKNLAAVFPGNPYYDANVRRYAAAWKTYWGEYIPQMIATRRVPDGAAWGHYPSLSGEVTSTASEAYNVMVHSFGPGCFKGIVFLCSEAMVREDQGARFGPELSALAAGWKEHFAARSVVGPGGEDPFFFYTIPSRTLAPKITRPGGIPGRSTALEIDRWPAAKRGDKEADAAVNKQLLDLIERVIGEAYDTDGK